MFSSAALSRILIASACCSCVDSPGLLGQSMLPTVATHTPRNSRGAGGGSSDGLDAAALCCCAQPIGINSINNVPTNRHGDMQVGTRRRVACSMGARSFPGRVGLSLQDRITLPKWLI